MKYEDAGVSLGRADKAMKNIKNSVKSTFNDGVLGDIGNFGGLFSLAGLGYKDPVLVSSVDGVGTKLKLSFATKTHDRPGQDIVNHCVDDILVQGARPLFFLDYMGTGVLEPDVLGQVVSGMAKACRENGCVLIGGETAEMPGFYEDGEYDISGTIVGVVERSKVIDGKSIRPGTKIIGLPSSGLHTNGYSLARKALIEHAKLPLDKDVDGRLGTTLGDALTTPHISYLKQITPLLEANLVQGLVHVTGSGFQGNIPRILPDGVSVKINRSAWKVPELFRLIQEKGNVDEDEMYNTFNMGLGLLVFTAPENAEKVNAMLQEAGVETVDAGMVVAGNKEVFLED